MLQDGSGQYIMGVVHFTSFYIWSFAHLFIWLTEKYTDMLWGFIYCRGGTFVFSFQVPSVYPHDPPKVKCKTKVSRKSTQEDCLVLAFMGNLFLTFVRIQQVYHPNIDLEGNVCLNILREDWKPVLNVNTVIYGLYHLFTVRTLPFYLESWFMNCITVFLLFFLGVQQPNYEDPLNHDAAAVLRDNPKMFESNVKRAMAGGYVVQTYFPRCLS